MEKIFKVGDRVKVTHHEVLNEVKTGTIVAIDKDGDYLVKLDDFINSFKFCQFTRYQSDRRDLINIEFNLGQKIELV